ncbi:MAG: GNAT family N-acetyltransferase [Spirosomataceae bacterium]
MNIRIAKISDAENLRNLTEVTFRDKYTVFNTPENMEMHVQKYFGLDKISSEIEDAQIKYFVVENGQQLIGYAKLAIESKAENLVAKKPVEIQRFYVHQDFQGRKIGQKLMETVIDWAKNNDFDVVWLGAWENNPDALRFYQRLGFEIFGKHTFLLGEDVQNDFTMKKEIFP